MLKTLTTEDKKNEPMQHALKIRDSLAQGNYARFFKLYRNAPNMGSSLIDVFIDKIRIVALQKLTVGYLATNIDIAFITKILAFEDAPQCEKFLLEQGKCGCISNILIQGANSSEVANLPKSRAPDAWTAKQV
jgi:hypothetical protein